MAPKKKQPASKQKQKPKPSSSAAAAAPRLQISSENERRLRRLLLNSSASAAPSPASTDGPGARGESREQKARRLRGVYDKLALEGFTSAQIEQALSAIPDSATFESALDWLCFNLPGDELPLKFSSGGTSTTSSRVGTEGSVKVLSTAKENWVPQSREPGEVNASTEQLEIRIGGRREENVSLDDGRSSQAAWIRQYMEQQEEEDANSNDSSTWEDHCLQSLEVVEAKPSRRKSKAAKKNSKHGGLKEDTSHSAHSVSSNSETANVEGGQNDLGVAENNSDSPGNIDEGSDLQKGTPKDVVETCTKVIEEEEVELDGMFFEDSSAWDAVAPEILKQQKIEKLSHDGYGHLLGNIDDIWKKGDSGKMPKAVLQKFCQRLGWEAPKYSKVSEKGGKFVYAVSVLRGATGRGKSRKAGGLTKIQLPEIDEEYGSVEEAQSRVAAFALYQFFADLPLRQLLTEPYSSLVLRWQEGELLSTSRVLDTEDSRRAGFVDMLLNMDADTSHIEDSSAGVILVDTGDTEDNKSVHEKRETAMMSCMGVKSPEHAESAILKKQLEDKKKLPNYLKMLEARASLPIAKQKQHFLQLLKDNDVIVVSGETGCGKTTQVPQFILDDMIDSELGGYCNIICTQPRRIAAISVAERVSDERCESSPGSNDSLVGYQVRLDSARNERTKLLFCTTGILLRKLSGNRDLSDITHVVVDEVHERTILSDFLLIVLKNLVEKRSNEQGRKLKVILMSATVDSSLFARYFGECPVISVEGRTHPVSTHFLEDVYEKMEYCLELDSPASGAYFAQHGEKWKHASSSVNNRRGKKNLVLSSWGDESTLSEGYVNPHYVSDYYKSYSERTNQNLKRLNEDVIDFDLLEDLICFIDENCPPGALLVFLPGVAEIDMLIDRLSSSVRFGGASSDWILPLHSLLGPSDQRKVFQSPPDKFRKVIVATDIAETSITIDDVIYVVDTGKHKQNRFNPRKKMSSIVEDWISRANAKQRRGRAGRVKPGLCFCLYTRHRFENIMRPFQVPEMLRMPLTELCLQIKSLHLGDIKSFLLKAVEPPNEEAISSAVDLLYKVGAFEGHEELSPLGYHLAKLPVDVLIGKMMLYGAIFGCLSPILSVAAFLSYKSPFISPKDEKQNVEKAKATLLNENLDGSTSATDNKQSDHLVMVIAYDKWSRILLQHGAKSARQFCHSFYLNSTVMHMIRDMRLQFGTLLADIGLIDLPKDSMRPKEGSRKSNLEIWFSNMSLPFNAYARCTSVIKSVICAGLYPNVAASLEGVDPGALGGRKPSDILFSKDRPRWYDGRREVHIHPSSVNHSLKAVRYPFLVFLEKVETTKVFLRDTSVISPYSLLLFGGSMVIQHQTGVVVIDGWLRLSATAQTAVLFKQLRITLDAVLKELTRKPEMATFVDNEVVRSIIHLLLEEDKAQLA
ncbi:DExH-box ATP-dependent RNA helicase DExH7, chloroplastic-like isoform X2 [Panicum virgatum]|uniref:DExH-box ATP-dependent RNA helicase DExH7, chloroplastic-like isoform X2 n=1 Tax=Panicum virgatum TaxID=38727 RepID=UPI0019D664A6|nr:DExH-box ATP-dependent RNA helicase DExH7, chloroplastic-like isoform X2 [Panicum virgatum]XP_039818315.1 DExH-box ATP-dependent RNA helicase DExH7, chloroplastic-like isoform X2 [Panicum virgatum]